MGGLWGEVPRSPLLTSDFSEVISWRQRRIYLVKSKDFHRWDEGPVPLSQKKMGQGACAHVPFKIVFVRCICGWRLLRIRLRRVLFCRNKL